MNLKTVFIISCAVLLLFSCNKEDASTNSGSNKNYNSFTDSRDGHVYKTIKIGNQIWMSENLKTTKYRDGRDILNVTNDDHWDNLSTGAYCYYNNLESNKDTYGLLYNWFAVNEELVAPEGWHIPSSEDWNILVDHLIANGFNYDGSIDEDLLAKSLASTSGWNYSQVEGTPGYNPEKNNTSGINALPGGFRNAKGEFRGIGDYGYWWSSNSTKDYGKTIFNNRKYLKSSSNGRQCGISVRLIKNDD